MNKFIPLVLVIIAFALVVTSLPYIPGSFANDTKYYKKDGSEIETKDLGIPISLLSFTLLVLLISAGLIFLIN